QMLRAFLALVQSGEELHLVADLGVGGEVLRLEGAATQTAGGLAFGGVVLALDTVVHQAGRLECDGLPKFSVAHGGKCADMRPIDAARGQRDYARALRGCQDAKTSRIGAPSGISRM